MVVSKEALFTVGRPSKALLGEMWSEAGSTSSGCWLVVCKDLYNMSHVFEHTRISTCDSGVRLRVNSSTEDGVCVLWKFVRRNFPLNRVFFLLQNNTRYW